MSDLTPLKPQGHDEEGQFMEQVHERSFGGRFKLRNNKNVSWDYTPNGIYANIKAAQASPVTTSKLQQFIFIASYGDYIIGQTLAQGAALQRIAKVYEHRNSIAQTVIEGALWVYTYSPAGAPPFLSRIAQLSGASYFEYQRIRPPWIPASNGGGGLPAQQATHFYADQPSGGTGVVSVADIIDNHAGTPVVWLDQNRGARAWTRKADQTTP